jgi:flagellar hook assembly protein FlgD
MAIFTVAGRKVMDKDLGPQGAGIVQWDWAPKDQAGRPLANGLYFVRLTTEENKTILKWLLYR